MMSPRTLSLSLGAAALCSCFASGAFAAVEYGTVVSSTPVIGQVAVPQRDCYDEQVAVPQRSSGGGALAGAIIGGVIGNTVGSGMGRAAATGLGMVAGAALGDHAEASNTPPAARTVQRCRTVSQSEDRLIGYDVVYEYGGVRRTARMAQDPGGPGSRIAVEVNVASSAAPRGERYGTPVPPPSTRRAPPPSYDDGYYSDEPPARVVYSAPYYVAPPPVYAPYPAVMFGPPVIWIGGSWHHGRRW